MALFLNASLSSTSKPHRHNLLKSKPSFSTTSATHLPLFLLAPNLKQQVSQKLTLSSFGASISSATLVALLSASLFFVDPALAFKGGGPYGQGVTRGQDLSGKDFSGKTLIKQDFKTSILRQANFKGADLSDADLRSADFSLANVTKVNLSNANLEGALVTGNTSFKGSNITGADFTDVPLREDQREYLCKIADGVNSTTGNATHDTLLCN
ncbi:unnamed protein product [Trifolium pratense]|uniref:Uncharacterized protein n=1 Tax=Trifolium pratense TaxID=57577 RepID=A0ACB0J7A8_TRIPR|nr:unnamed protein product [Trifolium pratense]